MKLTSILVVLGILSLAAANSEDVCSGKFGHPLGTYLKIEGVRAEKGKGAQGALVVDTVNGKKLEKPIGIPIQNLEGSLPKDTRCVLRGYETGKMIGVPPAVFEAAKEEGKEVSVPQAGWQFYVYFVALSAVEPKDLKIRR
jgi:hypothetical protein